MPTASVMEMGATDAEFRFQPDGVMSLGIQFGMFRWMTIGLSHGMEHWLGYGKTAGYTMPGILIKYNLCGETKWGPAVTLGVDTQGWGEYSQRKFNPAHDGSRFMYKAPGFYGVASKNIYCRCFGLIGAHGGIMYNAFEKDDDNSVNAFVGLDRNIWKWFSASVEYNFAFDDNAPGAYGNDGYINALLRFKNAEGSSLEFIFMDLSVQNKYADKEFRAVRLIFPLDLTAE